MDRRILLLCLAVPACAQHTVTIDRDTVLSDSVARKTVTLKRDDGLLTQGRVVALRPRAADAKRLRYPGPLGGDVLTGLTSARADWAELEWQQAELLVLAPVPVTRVSAMAIGGLAFGVGLAFLGAKIGHDSNDDIEDGGTIGGFFGAMLGVTVGLVGGAALGWAVTDGARYELAEEN